MGPNFCDEIDLFDNIDDLIQFPPDDNECVGKLATSDDYKDVVPAMWSGALPEFSADLSVPYEDIAQLEWLSIFVEDSFSAEGGLTLPKHSSCDTNKDDGPLFSRNRLFQSSSPVSVLESHSSSSSSTNSSCSGVMLLPGPHRGPQRARSKRPRPATFNPRPPTFIELPQPFVAPGFSSESGNFGESQPLKKFSKLAVSGAEEPKKKKKKKIKAMTPPGANREEDHQNPPPVRKCLHCEITKTPQWRAGPMGPKTLCNACGVRFKSGRLFPEYRPAASPTFVPSVHSNSHKKVIEMRNKSVAETPATTVSELVSNP